MMNVPQSNAQLRFGRKPTWPPQVPLPQACRWRHDPPSSLLHDRAHHLIFLIYHHLNSRLFSFNVPCDLRTLANLQTCCSSSLQVTVFSSPGSFPSLSKIHKKTKQKKTDLQMRYLIFNLNRSYIYTIYNCAVVYYCITMHYRFVRADKNKKIHSSGIIKPSSYNRTCNQSNSQCPEWMQWRRRRYTELVTDVQQCSWKAKVQPTEVDYRGFIAHQHQGYCKK